MSGSPLRRIEALERRVRNAMPDALPTFLDTLTESDKAFLQDLIHRGMWDSHDGLSEHDKYRAETLQARYYQSIIKEAKRS